MKRLLFILLLSILLTSQAICTGSKRTPVPGSYQIELYKNLIEGKSVAMVANQTSMVGETHLVDTLISIGINIKAIFAPEHGFRNMADAGETIVDSKDPKTGVPLISLYGTHFKPTPADLAGIDLVIFDIQDVGVRFYTYISTLHYVLEACAETHIKCMVLDRPNPNGFYVDGNIIDTAYTSFVARMRLMAKKHIGSAKKHDNLSAASLTVRPPKLEAPTLTVGEIAERLRHLAPKPTTIERMKHWTREGLLVPLEKHHAGTGKHRRYDQSITYDAGVLSVIADAGLHIVAHRYLLDGLSQVRRTLQNWKAAKRNADLFLEISYEKSGSPIIAIHEGAATPKPTVRLSILINLTLIVLEVDRAIHHKPRTILSSASRSRS